MSQQAAEQAVPLFHGRDTMSLEATCIKDDGGRGVLTMVGIHVRTVEGRGFRVQGAGSTPTVNCMGVPICCVHPSGCRIL